MTAPLGPFLSDTPTPRGGWLRPPADEALAPELAYRLGWLVRLRWGASAILAGASVAGAAIGLATWPALLGLSVAIALYNIACLHMLGRLTGSSVSRLYIHALAQIGLDLTSLLVALHLTGGLSSPLLPFFGFHMAIGTMLLATETMYFAAALTSLSALGLHLLTLGGDAFETGDAAPAITLLAFVGFLFGTVYLTGSVSDALKQRNWDLRRTTTALRERSTELQRLYMELEELERRKSHYMRISAHQLRSPLGTIRTSLDVLTGGFVDLGSERAQRLIRGAADRVSGLLLMVNGLLDLAKVREGRQRAPWTRHVNVNQLVADLMDTLGPLAEERGVRLIPRMQGVAILEWGVPPDLVHAIENLVHNAIKYSFRGGDVIVHLCADGEWAVLRVEDHGIGVPQEFREHLFLEFMRAPNARGHAPEGTGLGLALVREVAAAHGGRVSVDAGSGCGATFCLELPQRLPPPEGIASVTAP